MYIYCTVNKTLIQILSYIQYITVSLIFQTLNFLAVGGKLSRWAAVCIIPSQTSSCFSTYAHLLDKSSGGKDGSSSGNKGSQLCCPKCGEPCTHVETFVCKSSQRSNNH